MSFFSSLFSNNKPEPEINFENPVKTELHSHLIPGIDDGVQTIDQSIEILRAFSNLGYRKVITTPHIMGDFYKNGPFNIIPGLELVREKLESEKIDIELTASAEYMVDELLETKLKNKELLPFGKNYILVELPFDNEPLILKKVLFELQINGYKPVLAHPERYPYMSANKNRYKDLFESDILFQVNILSLLGYYSPEARKSAEYLIDHKMVNMVGSDTHHINHIHHLEKALKTPYYQKVCELDLLNNQL